MNASRFQGQCLAYFGIRHRLVVAQIQDLIHVESLNLLVKPSALLLFFVQPLLRRRLLALELTVESMDIIKQSFPLFIQLFLLLSGDHHLKLNGHDLNYYAVTITEEKQ